MQLYLIQRYENRKWILLGVHFIMLLMNYKMYIIKINIREIAPNESLKQCAYSVVSMIDYILASFLEYKCFY